MGEVEKLQKTAHKNKAGFTLVELLVALAMAAMVAAAIYRVFTDQQRVYIVEDQVAEMQQNLRAAMTLLSRDIRMAGYDPIGSAGATCISASSTQFRFTMDLNADGDCSDAGEDITYDLGIDSNNVQNLRRKNSVTSNAQPVIPHVDNLEFYYSLADGTQTLAPSDPSLIRLVQISLLVHASRQDQNYLDTRTYSAASGAVWGPFNDHYRRRFLTTMVMCQNMGLLK